jgi:hypothetical protein
MIDLLGMEHSRHLAEHAYSLEIRMASIEKNFKLKVFSETIVATPKALDESVAAVESG